MTISQFLNKVNEYILNPLIYLVFVLAFIYFMYGIVKFVNPNTAEKDKIDARNGILWGLVGMAIMFSVYGLINFVIASLGIQRNTLINGQNVTPTGYIDDKLNQ